MESLINIWKNKTKIGNTNWTLSGNSIAGIRTSFYCNELKILLDAGYQNFNKIKEIFITHSHADHISCLPLIILENINNKIECNIYCPEEIVLHLENMVDSFLKCNYYSDFIPKKYYNFIGMNNKYLLNLRLNGTEIKIESINSIHTVPTLSYGFIEVKKKLKEEYKDLPNNEIVKLKNSGLEIVKKVEEKKMIFCGDTSFDIFTDNPGILCYDNIIIECTFFDKDELKSAKERKHMHWDLLKRIILENPNIDFYLIHISAKYIGRLDLIYNLIKEFKNVFIL